MNVIEQKKNKNYSESDGNIIKTLKSCSLVVENAITNAFNKCIVEKKFPKILKIAKEEPILKKDDTKNTKKHTPINILSFFSKLCENSIRKRMVKFCDKKELFGNNKYGTRLKNIKCRSHSFNYRTYEISD